MYPRYLRVEYKFLLVLRPDASLGFADALALFIVFLQPQKAQRSSSSRVRSLEPEKAMKIKEQKSICISQAGKKLGPEQGPF